MRDKFFNRDKIKCLAALGKGKSLVGLMYLELLKHNFISDFYLLLIIFKHVFIIRGMILLHIYSRCDDVFHLKLLYYTFQFI